MSADALHILDASCETDTLLEALLLAGAPRRCVCLSPPPEWAPGIVRCVSLRRLRGDPPAALGALAHGAVPVFHSTCAAGAVVSTCPDLCPRLVLRLSAPPTPDQAQRIVHLARQGRLGVACASEAAAGAVRRTGAPAEVCVIPPPAVRPEPDRRDEARRRLGLGPEDILLLAPGHVHARSGHRLGIWAAAVLSVMELPVRLAFRHTGQAARDAVEFARTAGFGDRAVLVGLDEPLGPLLSAADAGVFLQTERPPGVLLASAMRAGLAIVAADVPAMRDWLTDGRTALLVPPHGPGAIAQALLRLIEDRPLAERLGAEAARQAGEPFDPGGVAALWRGLHDRPGGAIEAVRAPAL